MKRCKLTRKALCAAYPLCICGLTDKRCQCRAKGCGLYFNSVPAFDKHRVGEYGVDRRCLTVEEMLAKGMGRNASGFWLTRPFVGAPVVAFSGDRSKPMSLPTQNDRRSGAHGEEL